MTVEIYFGIGVVCAIAFLYFGYKSEIFQDDFADGDFFDFVFGWFMLLLLGGIVLIGWPVISVGIILISLAWLPWASQQQRKHIKRYGKPDEDYMWQKFIPGYLERRNKINFF